MSSARMTNSSRSRKMPSPPLSPASSSVSPHTAAVSCFLARCKGRASGGSGSSGDGAAGSSAGATGGTVVGAGGGGGGGEGSAGGGGGGGGCGGGGEQAISLSKTRVCVWISLGDKVECAEGGDFRFGEVYKGLWLISIDLSDQLQRISGWGQQASPWKSDSSWRNE